MATWTDPTTIDTSPDAPVTSEFGTAALENPEALAEGAPGAPKIDPINAMAHGGALGAVGTYATLMYNPSGVATEVIAGNLYSGSALEYGGVYGVKGDTNNVTVTDTGGGTPSGTWRAMCEIDTGGFAVDEGIGVFLRVS